MAQIQILSLSVSLMSCDGAHTHKVDVSVWGELFLQRFPALGLWETLCVWAGGGRICCFRAGADSRVPLSFRGAVSRGSVVWVSPGSVVLGDGFLDNGCWSGCFWDEGLQCLERGTSVTALKKREEGKYGQKLLRLNLFMIGVKC